MAVTEAKKAQTKSIWTQLQAEAEALAASEPAMARFLQEAVLSKAGLGQVMAGHLAAKLGNDEIPAKILAEQFALAFTHDDKFLAMLEADILAVHDRDPACKNYLNPILFFKGFLALQTYRAAHWLLQNEQHGMAIYMQNRASEIFGIDIHPAAKIGQGIMIDHASGVVIGETAVIGNDVSMLHGVTLGGSGKESGDRHPKIGNGVLISVGAKVLGNIRVGDCAKIGAGSVVLTDIPAYSTAVGVPAKVVGKVSSPEPSRAMDHSVNPFSGDGI